MVPAARFTTSRHYLPATILAFAAAAFSAWCGTRWSPAFVPAVLLFLIGGCLLYSVLRPSIEIYDLHLSIGRETIAWNQIRRIDRTRWVSPLVLYLTLLNDRRIQIFYAGDAVSGQALLRYLRRNAREALIDGVPYRQFWGEILPAASPNPSHPIGRPQGGGHFSQVPDAAARGRGGGRAALPAPEGCWPSGSDEPIRLQVKWIRLAVAACILLVSGWFLREPVLNECFDLLVRSDPPAQADLAVVLGGDGGGFRILTAGQLVRDGFVPAALISGPTGNFGVAECDLAIPFAAARGYPE